MIFTPISIFITNYSTAINTVARNTVAYIWRHGTDGRTELRLVRPR